MLIYANPTIVIGRSYLPDDILDFGKNEGYTLAEVYKYEPTYLEWLIVKNPSFKINIDEFYKLPNPTPFHRGYLITSEIVKEIQNKAKNQPKKSLLEEFKDQCLTDSINASLDVKIIKKIVDEDPGSYKPIEFKFADEIKKLNEEKIQNQHNLLD